MRQTLPPDSFPHRSVGMGEYSNTNFLKVVAYKDNPLILLTVFEPMAKRQCLYGSYFDRTSFIT